MVQAKDISNSESATKLDQNIPRATHVDRPLKLGELEFDCAVLESKGRDIPLRVLSERGVARMFGKTGRGSPSWYRQRGDSNSPSLPLFLSARNLMPYIPVKLLAQLSEPIVYKGRNGARTYGIEATLLGDICKVWVDAYNDSALDQRQQHIGRKAEILRDALVGVAITALVDDATGYTMERNRDELHRILEAYIAPELLPWTKRFPDSFYTELFRIRGWKYDPPSPKRPKYVGKLTNELIYNKLPSGVLDELRRRNPVLESGNRRYKFHMFLTEDIGNEHLSRQLASVTTLMRVSNSWSTFRRLFDKAFPENSQLEMELDLGEEDIA